MAPLAVEPEDEAQVPLVADRDAVPTARLSDDQEVGPMPGKKMARAAGIALLPDRADDDYLTGLVVVACRDKRRCERAFRVA